jgi:hypothetical protein
MANQSKKEGSEAGPKRIPARLIQALRHQKLREGDEAASAIDLLKKGQLPTPEETRQIINTRVGRERERILSNHIFWKEKKLREGLQAIIASAHAAHMDICRHNAALTSYARQFDSFQDHIERTVVHPFQKEVMAFCASAFAVIDTVRRIRKIRPDIDDQIKAIVGECFTSDLCAFVLDLRKNLSHGSVVLPGWQVRMNDQGTSGKMKLEAQELLSFGEWSASANRYIGQIRSGQIDVAESCGAYFDLLVKFDKAMRDIFARHVRDAERDYYEIEDTYHRKARRQWIKILVSQVGKGKNPYDYLHRFFSPEEVREILLRPKNSKEQVNYIVSLRSVEMDCDDDLLEKLYELFQVPKRE